MKTNICFTVEENVIRCTAAGESETPFVEYVFASKQKGSRIGMEIVTATLLNYAILDLLNSPCLVIQNSVSPRVQEYLSRELSRYCSHYGSQYAIEVFPILCFEGGELDSPPDSMELNPDFCFLGFSGGKDSTLSYNLIEDDYRIVHKFKINFDEDEFIGDYKTQKLVIDADSYARVSTEYLFRDRKVPFYQEDDMHVVFAAPYFSVKEGSPAHIAVGIPWDNLNALLYSGDQTVSEYVLSETQESLESYSEFLHSFGFTNFRIFSPIATLNSFAVYYALMSKLGSEYLLSLDSCWYSYQYGGKRCMTCNKCKRLTLIYSRLGIADEGMPPPTSDGQPLNNIFGSYSIERLLRDKYPDIERSVYLDEKIVQWDNGYHNKLIEEYGLISKPNPLSPKMRSNQ